MSACVMRSEGEPNWCVRSPETSPSVHAFVRGSKWFLFPPKSLDSDSKSQFCIRGVHFNARGELVPFGTEPDCAPRGVETPNFFGLVMRGGDFAVLTVDEWDRISPIPIQPIKSSTLRKRNGTKWGSLVQTVPV